MKTKSAQCKFGSILVCILFYVQNTFPMFGKATWNVNRPIAVQIGEFIEQLGDTIDFFMKIYFEDFKQ